ncbi:hypothetical protein FPQ18DRAFT_355610 [Pyronema domesticum]|nr:hypothetical protein FPQ18DRAFT_355610 [Pyronema domesticum]
MYTSARVLAELVFLLSNTTITPSFLCQFRHLELVSNCYHCSPSRDVPRLFTTPILYRSGNFEMSIHGAWEDLPLNVTGYCFDDADMEAEAVKVSNSKESL